MFTTSLHPVYFALHLPQISAPDGPLITRAALYPIPTNLKRRDPVDPVDGQRTTPKKDA